MKKMTLEKLLGKKLDFLDKINSVKMDSRSLQAGDVFIAIRGGNSYIQEALDKEVSLIICEVKGFENNPKVIYVEDSIKLMQNWAKLYLEKLDIMTIAITGSNGKTSTKDIIYSLLSKFKKGIKTQGNYNNHIGLPYTILQIDELDEFAVLELGMSNFGEIDILGDIVKPNIACITIIGDSHLENLGNRLGVFKAKTELLKHVKDRVIVNGDDEYLYNLDAIKVGFEDGNNYVIDNYEEFDEHTIFSINNNAKLETNLQGKHNILNITMAIAVLEELGYSSENYEDILKNIELTKMRFEKILRDNKLYINDAYNASPVSMNFALDTFGKIYNDRKKIVVLGDMLELGIESEKLHRNLASTLAKIDLHHIYLYGDEMAYLYEELSNLDNVSYYRDKSQIKLEISKIKDSCAILLKGSRGMKLEEIIE